MKLSEFNAEKLSAEEMNPIVGGMEKIEEGCKCGKNSTKTAGADTDTKSGDSDTGVAVGNFVYELFEY
jgi:natural product precursor